MKQLLRSALLVVLLLGVLPPLIVAYVFYMAWMAHKIAAFVPPF